MEKLNLLNLYQYLSFSRNRNRSTDPSLLCCKEGIAGVGDIYFLIGSTWWNQKGFPRKKFFVRIIHRIFFSFIQKLEYFFILFCNFLFFTGTGDLDSLAQLLISRRKFFCLYKHYIKNLAKFNIQFVLFISSISSEDGPSKHTQ